ncbi:unnamed protein product [Larinioides sclopetarius]|uniref:Uncharacterized protein n=1 Tax=Larinioides sclopetarius TaxID=280406 RepID=A0AAV2BGC5_9ARAC
MCTFHRTEKVHIRMKFSVTLYYVSKEMEQDVSHINSSNFNAAELFRKTVSFNVPPISSQRKIDRVIMEINQCLIQ